MCLNSFPLVGFFLPLEAAERDQNEERNHAAKDRHQLFFHVEVAECICHGKKRHASTLVELSALFECLM